MTRRTYRKWLQNARNISHRSTRKRSQKLRAETLEPRMMLASDFVRLANVARQESFEVAVVDSTAYFTASDLELWKTDGTVQGTQLVEDINTRPYSGSFPRNLTVIGSTLYFSADNGSGRGLWRTDGSGTRLLRAEGQYFDPRDFAVLGDKLYFSAYTAANGRELWVSDGTSEGTRLLVDVQSGPNDGVYYSSYNSLERNLTTVGNKIFFAGTNGQSGVELWAASPSGEVSQVMDIDTTGTGSYPNSIIDVNGIAAFSADDGGGREPWMSDGTESGTYLLKDIKTYLDNCAS